MDAAGLQPEKKNWALPFFTLWGGQAVSLLGSQLVQFALVWWLTKTTGSATVLATATLVALLPQVMLGPIAGTLVDRGNRRLIMMLADGISAAVIVVLAVLFWNGSIEVWHIYVAMFVRSLAGAFHWAAMQASTTLMVPKEHYTRIQGFNQMLWGAMTIISAPLGALLLEFLPIYGILAIDIVTAAIAILPLFFIHVPQPAKTTGVNEAGQPASVWQDFKAGFRYVFSWPGLVMILVMATIINLLLTPAGALQPILVTKHFGGGALQLAWLEAAWGIGTIAGGLLLGIWGGFKRKIITSLAGLVLLGLSMGLIGLVPSWALPLAIALGFLVGFSNPIVNGPLFAVLQNVVAPDMQGRVFTLIGSVAGAMSPIGLLLAGPLADRYGVQTWYLVGGIATVLLAVVAFMSPTIMNIEERQAHDALPEQDELAPYLSASD